METWLAASPWPGVILWIILYISDYYLTLYSARGFREIGHFQFEGSFELTPQYQNDIDHLRPISKLHLTLLVALSLLILVIWWMTRLIPFLEWSYLLYLGMFLLAEVAVHIRHLRNVSLIREIRKHAGVTGQISYRKWFSYRISASEFYTFSALFLIVAALTFSLFFVGGAIICAATAFQHSRLARRAKSASQAVVMQT